MNNTGKISRILMIIIVCTCFKRYECTLIKTWFHPLGYMIRPERWFYFNIIAKGHHGFVNDCDQDHWLRVWIFEMLQCSVVCTVLHKKWLIVSLSLCQGGSFISWNNMVLWFDCLHDLKLNMILLYWFNNKNRITWQFLRNLNLHLGQ